MPSANDEAAGGSGRMLEASRRDKLKRLQELGIDPWGGRFDGHASIAQILARQDEIVVEPKGDCAAGQPPELHGPQVRAAGRIVLRRIQGKKMQFLHLKDWTGRIQVLLSKSLVGDENWAVVECLDLGDIVGIDGEFKRTKTGEPTIFADRVHFLTKSIETPPAKHEGLSDPELRQRMRYLDLIHTEGVLDRFLKRTKIVHSIRRTLAADGFVEVEGPTLHAIAGGAAARPFVTHHNALDIDLYLRIALELHLKRLLVGGMERVYELGRVYRNEGISPRHNPEFTMLEVYQAYGDYRAMMDLTERLIVEAIRASGQPL
ncbi:MAG: OB-fold nucleic acid binding domain-containing protein, partial [Thermoguttaceae bacterium]|nr:OB-fold nucleic acid binding domain-containing protein [Thermoguttaceae bacterium]